MRIAILNLQYDNNYGGNLQRYALITVLQRMGHNVTHLNLRFNYDHLCWYEKLWRYIKRMRRKVFIDRTLRIFPLENDRQKYYEDSCIEVDKFYNKYITHTKALYSKKQLAKQKDFDVYIVGSDQVWRIDYCKMYGLPTFFFDFLPPNKKRVAYGVSFGTDDCNLGYNDIKQLTPLYNKFHAVSVRESSALNILNHYKWNKPQATQVLDPTLLLHKKDYIKLIEEGDTLPSPGQIFCYILDPSDEKTEIIEKISQEKKLIVFSTTLNNKNHLSIQQWLRFFYDAEFVITDSYHGLLFSVIFNKPFKILINKKRGSARFESIIKMLKIPLDKEIKDWTVINNQIRHWQQLSTIFLANSLNI